MSNLQNHNLRLEDVLVVMPVTLRKALEVIDANALGIVFLVDAERHLKGSLTDGDARRALLAGANLDDPIPCEDGYYNSKPHALPIGCDIGDIWALLNKNLRCIPLLDNNQRVVDFSTQTRVRQFPVLQPDIGEQEIANVLECVTSGWVSSQGRFIGQLENDFADYLGGGYCIAVSNGTVALQLGLTALGVGSADEVIVPNFTFGASINAIIHSGATPVLVDVDPETWTLSLDAVCQAITSRTKAIMPVHLYGQPAHIDEIRAIAQEHKLLVIDDCAEALGATYKGRRVGRDADCSCFSFFANKLITTGEGGMVVFKSKEQAARARILRDHGMSPARKYWHEMAGFNFRMTNMQAAIGVAQLGRIDGFLARRKAVFSSYDQYFSGRPELALLPKNDWSENAYWLYTVILDGYGESARDQLVAKLCRRGVDARPGFYPMHQMSPYADFGKGDYPVSTYLAANSIGLPSSPGLAAKEIQHIAGIFLAELGSLTKLSA